MRSGDASEVNLTGTTSRARVDAVSTVATRILRVLTSSRYRKGSLDQLNFPSLAASLLTVIRRRVLDGAPVQLTLMAFPFKVPNPAKVGARRLPDLAELAAIRYLLSLARETQRVYAPGVRFEIIHDGALIADVFGVGLEEVRTYERYLRRLIEREDTAARIRCHDFETLQRAAGLDAGRILPRVYQDAVHWTRSARGTTPWLDCFRKTLGMMELRDVASESVDRILAAAENGTLPPESGEIEQRVHRAMVGYQVKDAIIHQCDPRPVAFPDAIHATTRARSDRLALWLVRRGNALLPWHGVGVLDRGGARVALAKDVAGDPDLLPFTLPGETTPFGYAAANLRPDQGAAGIG